MGAPVAVVALCLFLCFAVLFALLLSALYSVLSSFRKRLPSRVNCWFCNTNSWVNYCLRNSWTCKKCEQYNGFLPDGSYNVVLDTRTTNSANFNLNMKHQFSDNNGFCRKCNINQLLKIRQLSGFVPMNEKHFDTEIESFKKHLEKVYSLCSICKKYLKQKLSSEKGLLLGTKLLDNRVKHEAEKKISIKILMKDFSKSILKKLPIVFLIFALYNIFTHLELFLSKKILHITKKYFQNISSDAKNLSLPYFDTAVNVILQYSDNYNITPVIFRQYSVLLATVDSYSDYNTPAELKTLLQIVDDFNCIDIVTLIGFFLQLSIHVLEFNFHVKQFIHDILWSMAFYISRTGIKYFYIIQVPLAIILYIFSDSNEPKKLKTSKIKSKLKNLSTNKTDYSSEDDIFSDNSDSDSGESDYSIVGSNYFDKNSFKMSPNSVNSFGYKKQNPISSFCSNSHYKSLNNSFNKDFLNFSNVSNKNDSELDKSISSLSIGKLNKSSKTDPFTTRQYNCTSPNIFMPSPRFSKPILSPSRLVHGAQQSWVAGGYWGAENSLLYNMHETGSSSSQSSGFESLTSSMYRKNMNSFPPSRGESVSSECDRRTEEISRTSFNPSSHSFMPHKSPIFPNMNRNESVFIPSVPFDSNYNMMNSSAFARRNPDKSFVPLQGPFSGSSHKFPS